MSRDRANLGGLRAPRWRASNAVAHFTQYVDGCLPRLYGLRFHEEADAINSIRPGSGEGYGVMIEVLRRARARLAPS